MRKFFTNLGRLLGALIFGVPIAVVVTLRMYLSNTFIKKESKNE